MSMEDSAKHELQLSSMGKIIDTASIPHNEPSITFTINRIRIGCTKISPDAAKAIIKEWEKHFSNLPKVVKMQ